MEGVSHGSGQGLVVLGNKRPGDSVMKICNNKKYRTRSGYDVIIDRKRSSCKACPVTGRILGLLIVPKKMTWTSEGLVNGNCTTTLDLVRVDAKV